MPDHPAPSLAKNKGKQYVLLTIPVELREHFNGRKQLKMSTGTSGLGDAKRRQHYISAELYAHLRLEIHRVALAFRHLRSVPHQ